MTIPEKPNDNPRGFADERAARLFGDYDDQTLDAFDKYNLEHPDIFKRFVELACAMKIAGRKRYGAMSIIEAMRWEYDIANPKGEFKINNNFRSLFARLLAYQDPAFEEFFEFRTGQK